MSKWLGFGLAAACAAAIAAGCGGSGANTGGFAGDDGGSSSGNSGGSSGTGSSSGAGGDATASSSSGGSGSSSSSGFDASLLDIAFPDVFFTPDSSGSSSGTSDGGDGSMPCFPDGITCQGNVESKCSGGVLTTTTCSGANPVCANGLGCVVCAPGTGSCAGSVGTACNSTGTGTVTNNCNPAEGEACNGSTGTCTGDCANVGQSYIGCEYYAITMPNSALAQGTFPFAVSVQNTSPTKPAAITITGPGYSSTPPAIPAGGIAQYVLPWVTALSNANASTAVVAGGAYHIVTNEPVAVYQFNPRDYTVSGSYSYTNDASLLLPVNAMTQNYYAVTGATWDVYTGSVAVVATTAGTKVTYTGGGTIIAGAGLTAAGGTSQVLGAGDVLLISAAANGSLSAFGADQSGAHVTATGGPIEVFGGVDCTNMPAAVQYCDHIEEIVLPFETLRSDYLVVRPQNDYAAPQQYVKIVGTTAGTTLSYDPPIAGAPAALTAGQSSFFQATVDFHVTANQKIIVGQFMESQNNFGATCFNSLDNSLNCGDPASSVAVATAQFRTSYQFISPPTYNENYVSVIAPNGATVTVNGANYTQSSANSRGIGSSSNYWTNPVRLCGGGAIACSSTTGVNNASGTAPFGVQVYGYGAYTSYMYPGGLNLNRQ